MIRLYTPVIGNGSFGRLGVGIGGALKRRGVLAGVVPLDAMEDYTDYDGATAETGLMVGPPPLISKLATMGIHKERMLMLAPNSSWIPEDFFDSAREFLTCLLTPSEWGKKVLDSYEPGIPVEVYQHGVDAGFLPDSEAHDALGRLYETGSFRVAHLASTDRERKGTRELVRAWAHAVRDGLLGRDPMLRLVVDGWTSERILALVEDLANGNPNIVRTVTISLTRNFSVGDAAKFYRQHHAVCQPSRGEGFGLVPLEASACGVPIIATDCTGHGEHIRRGLAGVVVVPTGPDAPIDDGPEAHGPSLDWAVVEDALVDAYRRWPLLGCEAQLKAPADSRHWSWDNVTDRWLASRKEAS